VALAASLGGHQPTSRPYPVRALASRIDSYQFQGTLGSGAAGTVKLAYLPELDRHVAIKEFSPALVADPHFLERLRADAQVMLRLDSPNCVKVYDFIEEPGRAWLVSEYVEGASLRKILDRSGFLTPEQALGVLKGAVTGLAYGHSLGLLHRDIKPENLLADREGVSKLGDFGQALFSPGPGAAGGIPAGTPAYMSPEQVTGGVVDYRSDIYSSGAMLFEFLTGKTPFRADNQLALMRMHASEPVPDPRAANSSLPQGVAETVMRAMAKDPADRQPTAFQFLADLEQAAVAGYGPDWERRSSIKALVAAIVAMGGVPLVSETAAASGAGGGAGNQPPVIAPAGGEWWQNKWLIAGGVAGVLLLLLAGLALAGAFGGKKTSTPIAIAGASPSPTESPSPSPDLSPSPVPSPSPSPSPLPTPAAIPSPVAAPLTVSALSVYFAICQPEGTCMPIDNSAGPSIICRQRYFNFHEQYTYTNPGPNPIQITVHWTGFLPNSSPDPGPAPYPGELASPNTTFTHVAGASAGYPDNNPSGTGPGFVQFNLTWTNPDGTAGGASSPHFTYTCK
jgi:serine/threonine protein kinase